MKIFHHFENWKTGSGENFNIIDVFKKIKNLNPVEIHVGSDSHVVKENITYVTAICLTWPGNGGVYFVNKSQKPRHHYNNLQARLFEEVERSIHIANSIKTETGKKITIHIDANQNIIHKSAKYAKSLANYALGMGFNYLLKPDSWASATVADKYTK
tara:strand:- start:35027 stop:35497 length:471 start_codon:yes stop_codon:yes gene_type:complete